MMQKNEIVKVKIEDIGVGGAGIGKVDGYTLFIKDAIIGDVVEAKVMKAKKNYGYARLMNVLTPSKDRVEEPVCPMARKCGGCQIQEMKYPAQLAFKEAKVNISPPIICRQRRRVQMACMRNCLDILRK